MKRAKCLGYGACPSASPTARITPVIPIKLTLENFKCYRQGVPTLHLAGVHVACLSGANGNGKSSLLDAITWALWGDAVHRPQEELIHLGEADMRVELEFVAGGVSRGDGSGNGQGQRYRVIRRYARGRGARAGATSLELQVAIEDGEGDSEFRGISGNTVRETEAAIRKLVGMNYDTFVNSAFLVQGRADEFTTKRPAERQRVLADILGLGFYDRLQELARQKGRELATEIQHIEGEVRAWSQELSRLPEYMEELTRVEVELTQARERLAAVQQEAIALRERVESLRSRRRELEELAQQEETAREEMGQLRTQSEQHTRRIQEWEGVAARESQITQAFTRLAELRAQDAEMGGLREQYITLQTQQAPLSQQVDTMPTLEAGASQARSELAVAEEQAVGLQSRQVELQQMELSRQTMESDNVRLRTEMEELRSKVDMLKEGDAKCPLCGTELGTEGQGHIEGEYETQGKVMAQRFRQNAATLGELTPRQEEMATAVKRETADSEERRRVLHGRIAALAQQLEEASKAPLELAAVERGLSALGYDPSTHEQVREAMQSLTSAEEEHRLLQQATTGLPQERENLQRVSALADRRQETVAQAKQRLSAIQGEVTGLAEMEQGLEASETRRRAHEEQHEGLVARHGFLDGWLKHSMEVESNRAEGEATLSRIAGQREVFDQLAVAFGRTGVQALLVEAAMPELQAEANRLLGRMTDNSMHLSLETQRESHRGEAVETLEIKVGAYGGAGEGTRSYETFSGGEAFRINLALRIALSKLLAHRSGAPMPTLFIDEGFGTQDASGRERILDVIQSIADDFECILVITHMEEVKDAFPVRIEVERTANGSTFALT